LSGAEKTNAFSLLMQRAGAESRIKCFSAEPDEEDCYAAVHSF